MGKTATRRRVGPNLYKQSNGSYQVIVRKDGVQRTQMVPQGLTLEERKQFVREFCSGSQGHPTVKAAPMTFGAFLDRAHKNVKLTTSWSTARTYGCGYARWKAELGDMPLSKVRPADVEAARNAMLESGLTAKSMRLYLTALKVAYEWGIKQELVRVNPVAAVAVPLVEPREQRVMTQQEAQRLYGALRARNTPYGRMLALGLLLGVRTKSQLGAMRMVDLVEVDGATYYHLTRSMQGNGEIVTRPSNKHHARPIPLSGEALGIIEEQRKYLMKGDENRVQKAHTDLLWSDTNGDRLAWMMLWKEFRRCCNEAGVVGMTIHSTRHTFATLLGSTATAPKVLQDLLGHSNLAMTMHYVHRTGGADMEAATLAAQMITGTTEAPRKKRKEAV